MLPEDYTADLIPYPWCSTICYMNLPFIKEAGNCSIRQFKQWVGNEVASCISQLRCRWMATPAPPTEESLHMCLSRYMLQHIWATSFKKGLNIFQNAGTNCLLTILSPGICRMPIKVVSESFQSLVFKPIFGNLILTSQKAGGSTGQLWKKRVISINLGYRKARHVQNVVVQVPPAQGRGGQRSKGAKWLAPEHVGQLVLLNWWCVTNRRYWCYPSPSNKHHTGAGGGGYMACISKLNIWKKKDLAFVVLNQE